jgi:RimJ/RimL family protein N-acetyltransferase
MRRGSRSADRVGARDIPTLTTERLVLRPFEQDDLRELAAIHAEPSFWWYPLRGAMTVEQTAAFLTRVIDRYDSDGFGVEALLDRTSGDMIGWAGLAVPHFLPQILPAVEVGWRLAEARRGRGLATEAGAAALEWGFTGRGLDRIVSIYEPENVASGRVMERLGFTHGLTTTVPEHGETVAVMELARPRWEELRSAG